MADLSWLLLDGEVPQVLISPLGDLSPREATALILASPTYQLA